MSFNKGKTKPELDLNRPPTQRIVDLLQLGFNRDEVFEDIYYHCRLSFNSKNDKQELANCIAQIDECNVFAQGMIPVKEEV